MADMWVDLVPVLLAMMISPARTLAVILLLHTPGRAATSLAYVCGMVAAMMVQGTVLGMLMRFVGLTDLSQAASLEVFIGALFLVGGVILLVGATRMARPPAGGGGALQTAISKLETASARTAGAVGFGWIFASPKQWVFTLTAVSVIYAAYLRPIAAIGNYLLFAALVQLVYLVIIAIAAAVPGRIDPFLDGSFRWIRTHLRTIAVTVFTVLGVMFVLNAVSILQA